MPRSVLFASDLVAIAVLTFGLSFPRHRRRDLVVTYLGLNVGVLAVADALSSTAASAGLGLGLFGVLSIIRLRSAELDQHEVAYFFASLALGLIGGLRTDPEWLALALMATILAALYVGDHPRLFNRYRAHSLTLDRAFTDERELHDHLETVLGARVHRLAVRKVDLVNDTTNVEVRYEVPAGSATGATGVTARVGLP